MSRMQSHPKKSTARGVLTHWLYVKVAFVNCIRYFIFQYSIILITSYMLFNPQ